MLHLNAQWSRTLTIVVCLSSETSPLKTIPWLLHWACCRDRWVEASSSPTRNELWLPGSPGTRLSRAKQRHYKQFCSHVPCSSS